MTTSTRHPLRLNVGFLLHEQIGNSRTFDFDHSAVHLGEDLTLSDLRGALRLTRTAQGLYGEGQLEGVTVLECVRCLSEFDQALHIQIADLFSYPPAEASDPLLSIPETGLLDLAPLLREYMLLEVPLRPMCRADCLGLCPECGNNRNESPCSHPDVNIDPRLAGLQALLNEAPESEGS